MKKLCFLFFALLFFGMNTSFTSQFNTLELSKLGSTYYNYGIPLDQLIPKPIYSSRFSIIVQKSSYTLFLKYDGRLVKSYPCVFGPEPISDKLCQGDNCTPEGNFRIKDIRQHYIWGYFLEFDYPNNDSWEKHILAKSFGLIPNNSDIGGDIGIHGVVDGLEGLIDTKENWTEGCVSLKNTDVIELAQNLAVGTPVKVIY